MNKSKKDSRFGDGVFMAVLLNDFAIIKLVHWWSVRELGLKVKEEEEDECKVGISIGSVWYNKITPFFLKF